MSSQRSGYEYSGKNSDKDKVYGDSNTYNKYTARPGKASSSYSTAVPGASSASTSSTRSSNMFTEARQPSTSSRTTVSGSMRQEQHLLPCLLSPLIVCNAQFRGDQFNAWHEHSLVHFPGDRPPERSMCIFCPEQFDTRERYGSWKARLEHIQAHLENGYDYETARPDYLVLKYCRDKKVISQRRYIDAARLAEPTPEEPPSTPKSSTWQPSSIKDNRDAARRREEREAHIEPRQEKRHERRQERRQEKYKPERTSSSKGKGKENEESSQSKLLYTKRRYDIVVDNDDRKR